MKLMFISVVSLLAVGGAGGVLSVPSAFADHHEDSAKTVAHKKHLKHPHQHKENCGHASAQHADHVDYAHDGHQHRAHGGHQDECAGPEPVAAPAGAPAAEAAPASASGH